MLPPSKAPSSHVTTLHPAYLAGNARLQERHNAGEERTAAAAADAGIVSKWRQKEKLKTTAVALVLCLNIGVDPPDVVKISPCARLECWVDPLSMQPAKALETIGKNLQVRSRAIKRKLRCRAPVRAAKQLLRLPERRSEAAFHPSLSFVLEAMRQ